jgi:small subunit ribosomal protein S13
MEVRIASINIPIHKHIDVALTSIFGIGRATARRICNQTKVNPMAKVKDLTEENIDAIRAAINFPVEGDLRRRVAMDIKRKIDIGCYEGIRHRRGLPLRQRTRTNARTRKGKRKPPK